MKASQVPELKTGQMITVAYFIGILIVLFIVYKILGAVGLIKTQAKKKAEILKNEAATALRDAEYFSPTFLKGKYPPYVPLGNEAKLMAADLHKAMAGLGTNEERIFSTFGRMKSKYNISEVALCYKQGYNGDLLTDLLNDLNSSERVTLWGIISKLPEK